MRTAGAPEEVIEAARQRISDERAFEVWPECWDAVNFFYALSTQWKWLVGAKAMRSGLDYTAVASTMQMLGLPRRKRAELFEDIQVMESAALNYWNENTR